MHDLGFDTRNDTSFHMHIAKKVTWQVNNRMDSEYLQNKAAGTNAGPMENIDHQLSGQLLSTADLLRVQR